jgi:adenosine kinase
MVEALVVTRGERGSTILTRDGSHEIPCVPPRRLADPTGVGDGYRAGFITGMRHRLPWDVVGRMGSLAATYVLEEYGTQRHHYTVDGFIQRYTECFGDGSAVQVVKNPCSA